MLEETDSAKDEANKVRPIKITPVFDKKAETIEEHFKEGGASMLNQADKTMSSNVDIVPKSTAMKRIVERRRTSRLLQAGNSPIMPPTLNTMTMVDCL